MLDKFSRVDLLEFQVASEREGRLKAELELAAAHYSRAQEQRLSVAARLQKEYDLSDDTPINPETGEITRKAP
jgi:hypothetical protein